MASNRLSEIPQTSDENIDFVQLHQIILNLYQNNKEIDELDSVNIVFIRELAYKCPTSKAVSNAKAILDLLFNEKVPDCQEDTLSEKSMIANKPNNSLNRDIKKYFAEIDNCESLLGNNYPDPFTGTTTIPYSLPEGVNGKIIILDINGKKIKEYSLDATQNSIIINTENWSTGTYFYTLRINGLIFGSKKMLIK